VKAQSICVVIPTHSRRDLLQEAIASVSGQPLIVVDDSPAGLELQSLSCEVLRTAGELGFSKACNRGLEWVEEKGYGWALLLNDDARLKPGALASLESAVRQRPDVDAAGPILRGPLGLESAGFCLSPRTARLVQRKDIPDSPRSVMALSGACLLLRSHLRFDERFPHAFEDVELGLRIRAEGRTSLLVPEAEAWHQGGATVDRRSTKATRDALRGHLRLVEGSPHKRALVLGYALGQVLKEGPRFSRLGALWQGWRQR